MLCTAHNLMLDMLDLQRAHFNLTELEEIVGQCVRD